MANATVVITQRVHSSVIDRLEPHARLLTNQSGRTLPATEIRSRCAEAEAMIAFMSDRIDAGFLKGCPRLRLVAGALKGYDNIDLDACTRRGVALSIVPDLLTAPTAELAIGLLIALGRQIRAGDALTRREFNGWRPILYGRGLDGAIVGIVGLGAVGSAIAQRLLPFGCTLLGYDPEIRLPEIAAVSLPELLMHSDAVILAAPLTPESWRLIDAERLAQMNPGALLVNIGRGAVVDEVAVAASLESGHLGGYAADVFACEDRSLPQAPEGIPEALLAQPHTLFTPHLGSAVDNVRERIALAAADNVLDLLAGRPPRDGINLEALTAAS